MHLKRNLKRYITAALCLAIILTVVTMNAKADLVSTSIADGKSLGNWEEWFPEDSSKRAGDVYTDKSVYTGEEVKTDGYFGNVKDKLQIGKDAFGNENFMVALSALGSTSEVTGYEYAPTDTMIVLDMSASMSGDDIAEMATGANQLMKELIGLNKHNRVGIVTYSDTVNVVLPLDRYNGEDFLEYESKNNKLKTVSGIKKSNGETVSVQSISVGYATDVQRGLLSAQEQFFEKKKANDTTIPEGQFQAGTKRVPIMVLMTDGEANKCNSVSTSNGKNTLGDYTTTQSNSYGTGGSNGDFTATFSAMLTAAWAKAEIADYYGQDKSYIYTLGYGVGNSTIAQYLLNPGKYLQAQTEVNKNEFNQLIYSYLGTAKDASVEQQYESKTYCITRKSDPDKVTSFDYADGYYATENREQLTGAFNDIASAIKIQSRYYSTLVEGPNPHQDGYISFSDEIGTGMEVKSVKGFYLGGDTLYTGWNFATKATSSSDDTKAFRDELLKAMMERFQIDTTQANALLASAKDRKTIYAETSTGKFSNYVEWYANGSNEYIGPYNGGTAPEDAKYLVRSYFYTADTDTSMLYALVRVRENLKTGRQIVDVNIPASLLPMVTYSADTEGNSIGDGAVLGFTCNRENPISLLYEVGTDSEITPYNVKEKMEGQDFRKNANGDYTFYTNRWRSDSGEAFTIPEEGEGSANIFTNTSMDSTVSTFVPSIKNQSYYYTEDTLIYDEQKNVFAGASLSQSETYYTVKSWVETSDGKDQWKSAYLPIPDSVLADGNNLEQTSAGWIIKKNTPKFSNTSELLIHEEVQGKSKGANKTNTLEWVSTPYLVRNIGVGADGYHAMTYHGNNGRLFVTPAQGIQLSKEVPQPVAGAADAFTFEIVLEGEDVGSSLDVHYLRADGSEASSTVTVHGGKVEVTLSDGDTAYLTGMAAGTTYTIKEKHNFHYIGTCENGTNISTGTIKTNTLNQVHFVNRVKSHGNLSITKTVSYPFGGTPDFSGIDFTVKVTFDGPTEELQDILLPSGEKNLDGATTHELGIKAKETVVFKDIPQGVEYKVEEIKIPKGFSQSDTSTNLEGTIINDVEAALVNNYAPEVAKTRLKVQGDVEIGRREWDETVDRYQVALQQHKDGQPVGDPIIVDVVKSDEADYEIDMSPITYEKPGVYSYQVYQVEPTEGKAPDVAYDKSIGHFTVKVADNFSGNLILETVETVDGTVDLEENDGDWTVEKDFTNVYNADTVVIPVKKQVVDQNGAVLSQYRGGVQFGLYADNLEGTPIQVVATDENGEVSFVLPITKDAYGTQKDFYIREIMPALDDAVLGMTYDTEKTHKVSIQWTGEDPTVQYNDGAAEGSLVFTNLYDSEIVTEPIYFSGQKTLNGGSLRDGDVFSFTLYETEADLDIENGTLLAETSTCDTTGDFAFGGVTFDTTGTKYLVLQETVGELDGICYDTTRYVATVEVTKCFAADGRTAILKAALGDVVSSTGEVVAADALRFNNTYAINDKETVKVAGQKLLSGRTMVEGEFHFALYEQGKEEPLYTVKNNLDGSFAFSDLEYAAVDAESYDETFVYEVREEKPAADEANGVTYDESVYLVTVHLWDDGQGGLKKEVNYTLEGEEREEILFENTYQAADTTLQLSGTKTLEGQTAGTFTFDLYETGEDFDTEGLSPYQSTTVDIADGTGAFGFTLNFGKKDEGLHYYVLEESAPEETKGIVYDSTRYQIVVSVYDNGLGAMDTLMMDVQNTRSGETGSLDALDFVNRYMPTPATWLVSGVKKYNQPLAKDQFTFVLKNAEDVYIEAKNLEDGSFVFEGLQMQKAGKYVFTVVEENAGKTENGITYDDTKYSVILSVYDDGEGALCVDDKNVSILKQNFIGSELVEEITFENQYNAPVDKPEENPGEEDTAEPEPEVKPEVKPEEPPKEEVPPIVLPETPQDPENITPPIEGTEEPEEPTVPNEPETKPENQNPEASKPDVPKPNTGTTEQVVPPTDVPDSDDGGADTGDNAPIGMWIVLLCTCSFLAGILAKLRRFD